MLTNDRGGVGDRSTLRLCCRVPHFGGHRKPGKLGWGEPKFFCLLLRPLLPLGADVVSGNFSPEADIQKSGATAVNLDANASGQMVHNLGVQQRD